MYRTTGTTIREHPTDSKWVFDNDQFSVNQFLHPYDGSVYFGLARSAGLSFWESSLYGVAGSFSGRSAANGPLLRSTTRSRRPSAARFWVNRCSGWPICCLRPAMARRGSWRELGAAIICAAHRIQPPCISATAGQPRIPATGRPHSCGWRRAAR
ncbi:MAG: DUF3943 domain-containing protein [Nitrospira sp.]|nr:DUF3943 domain-containing protein [Nitrospira sp.]